MDIQGPGGVNGSDRIEPQRVNAQASDPTVHSEKIVDHVEISEHAQLLDKLSQVQPLRQERVEELQRLIESGEFETLERIEGAATRLLEEL